MDTNTADEKLHRRVLRSAWVLLMFCTAASMAGSVYYAYAHGSGTVAAMAGMGSVAIVLWLAMHLHGGVSAARRALQVHPTAARSAAFGVVVLVGISLTASFSTLHALMVAEKVGTIPAVLIPAGLDVGVIVSTIVIFALDAALTKTVEASTPEPVEHPEQQEYLPHDAFDEADEEQFVEQETPPREAPRDALQERLVMIQEALKEQSEEQSAVHDDAVHEPVEAQTVTHPEPIREPVAEVKRPAADPFILTADADELASRIKAETTISIPVRSVVAVLNRAASGESQRKIAGALKGVSPTTVGRVITAAKDLQDTPHRELVAV